MMLDLLPILKAKSVSSDKTSSIFLVSFQFVPNSTRLKVCLNTLFQYPQTLTLPLHRLFECTLDPGFASTSLIIQPQASWSICIVVSTKYTLFWDSSILKLKRITLY